MEIKAILQRIVLLFYTIIHELTSLADPKRSLFRNNNLRNRADEAQFIVFPINSGCSQIYLNKNEIEGIYIKAPREMCGTSRLIEMWKRRSNQNLWDTSWGLCQK